MYGVFVLTGAELYGCVSLVYFRIMFSKYEENNGATSLPPTNRVGIAHPCIYIPLFTFKRFFLLSCH